MSLRRETIYEYFINLLLAALSFLTDTTIIYKEHRKLTLSGQPTVRPAEGDSCARSTCVLLTNATLISED